MVTPFKDDKLDLKSFEKLIAWQINEGIQGLVICGATGESTALTSAERKELITTALGAAQRRIPIIVGTSSSTTKVAIEYTQQAEELGADGGLVVTPYYNKPNQEGIYRHFESISTNSNLPTIIYNNPGRTVININDQTIARIAKLKNICGLKDSTGDLSRPISLKTHSLKEDFILLSGEDTTTVAYNVSGGHGIISITSNAMPKQCTKIQDLCVSGDYRTAAHEHQKLADLHFGMICETNPIPIKYALHLMGFISPEVRLPLVELQEESKNRIKNTLKTLKLI